MTITLDYYTKILVKYSLKVWERFSNVGHWWLDLFTMIEYSKYFAKPKAGFGQDFWYFYFQRSVFNVQLSLNQWASFIIRFLCKLSQRLLRNDWERRVIGAHGLNQFRETPYEWIDPPHNVSSAGETRNLAATISGLVQIFFSFHVISSHSVIEKTQYFLIFSPN